MLGEKRIDIKSGGDFDIAPMNKYTVQITDVNPKIVFSKYSNQEEEIFNFEFVILDDNPIPAEGDKEERSTRGVRFTQLINPTFGRKAILLGLAEAVLGREPTDEEKDNESPNRINVDDWVGKQIDAMIIEKPNSDNTAIFNKATTFSRVLKKLEPWMVDQSAPVTVEKKTEPAVKTVETPDLGDKDALGFEDAFAEGKSKTSPEKEMDKILEDDDDADVAELKAKLKAAEAKKAKTKKTKKK